MNHIIKPGSIRPTQPESSVTLHSLSRRDLLRSIAAVGAASAIPLVALQACGGNNPPNPYARLLKSPYTVLYPFSLPVIQLTSDAIWDFVSVYQFSAHYNLIGGTEMAFASVDDPFSSPPTLYAHQIRNSDKTNHVTTYFDASGRFYAMQLNSFGGWVHFTYPNATDVGMAVYDTNQNFLAGIRLVASSVGFDVVVDNTVRSMPASVSNLKWPSQQTGVAQPLDCSDWACGGCDAADCTISGTTSSLGGGTNYSGEQSTIDFFNHLNSVLDNPQTGNQIMGVALVAVIAQTVIAGVLGAPIAGAIAAAGVAAAGVYFIWNLNSADLLRTGVSFSARSSSSIASIPIPTTAPKPNMVPPLENTVIGYSNGLFYVANT